MVEIRVYKAGKTVAPFRRWLQKLKDHQAKLKINVRIDRLRQHNEGDWKPVGGGVRELRINAGKGYRVYYAWDGQDVVLLLAGGDKSTQQSDIESAKHYWRQYNAEKL